MGIPREESRHEIAVLARAKRESAIHSFSLLTTMCRGSVLTSMGHVSGIRTATPRSRPLPLRFPNRVVIDRDGEAPVFAVAAGSPGTPAVGARRFAEDLVGFSCGIGDPKAHTHKGPKTIPSGHVSGQQRFVEILADLQFWSRASTPYGSTPAG
jgi:hypothetical protein